MFDLFGLKEDEKELERARIQLQKSMNEMKKFYEQLSFLLIDLKELHSPDIDRLFEKYRVEVK